MPRDRRPDETRDETRDETSDETGDGTGLWLGRTSWTPRLFVPWLLLAAACSALMLLMPGNETIPYHLGYIALALAYVFDPWSPARTLTAVGSYTLVTGGILVLRAATEEIGWDETAEIPLMAILVLLSFWHVRRRLAATAQVQELAARDRRHAARDRQHAAHRERMRRLTSHEMRTPLTIATGYLDLLLADETQEGRRADLHVVQDELGRLTRAADRLVRMIRLQDESPREQVDLDELLHQVVERWATVAERQWVVDSAAGSCLVPVERLRACVDTLIENALRYTGPGDVVRVTSSRLEGTLQVGVADAGSGLSDELCEAINAQDFRTTQQLSETAPGGQTGLGLGLLHEMVVATGGQVRAGRSPEGGALVLMVLPDETAGAEHPSAGVDAADMTPA